MKSGASEGTDPNVRGLNIGLLGRGSTAGEGISQQGECWIPCARAVELPGSQRWKQESKTGREDFRQGLLAPDNGECGGWQCQQLGQYFL